MTIRSHCFEIEAIDLQKMILSSHEMDLFEG
jgi:hypothetical protein